MRRVENRKQKTPDVWTEEKILKTIAEIDKYIEDVEIPIIAEFCYKFNIRKQRLYEDPRMSDSIKRLLEKKEAQLERKGLDGNNTMAIFSLKQLGWKDSQSIEHSVIDKEKLKKEMESIFE